ncbi:uncharacterized protein SCHCODRAFT_02670493 [Schizophyllum commune H4-8]|nr:uncharacterized protein SCHCODRAFT_02670493 [Schizophyllum commune H4-8]KAI5889508.1 hypothetical protein SCHCODRAFT_02670493 [Schizophyllum commune H4-8]
MAPLRSKRPVHPNADAMDVDNDSSSDEGAWRPILATDFVKAAKKNPKPELASEVEEISDDSDEPYVAPRSPDIIAISSDSEDDVTIIENEEEEDELDLDRAPSEKLLEALRRLSLTVQRQGPSKLPFLRRCVRRGFLLTCKKRGVALSDGQRTDTDSETVYEYVIQNGVEYQARRLVRGYECPLCDLHGNFPSKAVYEKHLQWDHAGVKVETTETGGKRKVVIDVPVPARATARTLATVYARPIKKEENIEEASVPPAEHEENAAMSPTPSTPTPPLRSPVRRVSPPRPLYEKEEEEETEEEPVLATADSAAISVLPTPHLPVPTPSITVRVPEPVRARSPTALPSLPSSPSPPLDIPRRRTRRQQVISSPTASPSPPPLARHIHSPSPAPPSPTASLQDRPPLTPPPPHRRLGPSLSPEDPDFFPAYSDYPDGQTIYYSTRPEGPRLYDLLGTLPLAPYGALAWAVLDQEEEILEVPDIPDEQKVMQALWARWIFLHRLDFVKKYEDGARMFIDEHWRMIHKAAGWAALRNLLLVLYMNRFLKMNEVAILLRHYEELVRWDLWYS